jgi:FRG domain-containing protein
MGQWDAFLRRIETATANIDEPFFRGHAIAKWQLVPSLGGYKNHRMVENQLYYDFLTFGAPHMAQTSDSWDVLFTMRHHNLPTRLLDWSQSFSVALYFAVQKFEKKGAIWILDPYRLNASTTRSDTILHPQGDLEYTYYDYFIADPAKHFPYSAVAILPNKTTQRVLAQRGVFTLHRHASQSLESICSKALTKVEFDEGICSEAKRFLKLAGLSEYSLFPDLDGLSRWLYESHDLAKTTLSRVGRQPSKQKSQKGNKERRKQRH